MVSKSPFEALLISPPSQPDCPSWSAPAHVVDDLMRRAAWHGLMRGWGRSEDHERHTQQRRACIDGAKRIAAEQGWQDYNVEAHVKTIEQTTERAYKEWCDVHADEIMQRYYARNPAAARRLMTGDDGEADD